jgi:DNA polymerase-4
VERKIIHLNVADFAVGVERAVDRRLRTRAVVIAPDGGARATVYDMSDEAFRDGVRKGMPLNRAMRLARGATFLHPKPDLYERAMRAFAAHALPYSPLVEQAEGDGHIFIDATGTKRLFGHPQDVASKIRKSLVDDIRLNPIWSVASNKLVAKVATRIVKPLGEHIVPHGSEESFLKPLPLSLLPGIYPAELKLLRELNIKQTGEAGLLTFSHLEVLTGKPLRARILFEKLHGIDRSPVLPAGRKSSFATADHTFNGDTNDTAAIEAALFTCAERVGTELRNRSLAVKDVTVLIDYCDGLRVFRKAVSRTALFATGDIFQLALKALKLAWRRRTRLRHIRITSARFTNVSTQLDLFAGMEGEDFTAASADATSAVGCADLDNALDNIRNRFGNGAVKLGRTTALEAV